MGGRRTRVAFWMVVSAVLAIGLAGLLSACVGVDEVARRATATPRTNQRELMGARASVALVDPVWHDLAHCESRGQWHINSGNGFTGGLQFLDSTWLANGGGAFAPSAHLATPAQQVVVAERLRAQAGFSPWPACAAALGLP